MNQPAYEHNGRAVDAAAFYAIACDPRRSVAVEACAGAGKTWMLISRIVRALIEPGPDGHQAAPHEILAITFTRKAAGEMRRRLDEQLQNLALASDARLDQALLAFGVPPDRVPALREPLRGAWQAMLESGRPVQVRTCTGRPDSSMACQAPRSGSRSAGTRSGGTPNASRAWSSLASLASARFCSCSSSRRRISPAALRVKVMARISCGAAWWPSGPGSISARTMREISIQVLPAPAQASTATLRRGSQAMA